MVEQESCLCYEKMDKPFSILDNSMILVYDQPIEDDHVGQASSEVDARPSEFDETEKQIQSNRSKDDFLIESYSNYCNVENCAMSSAKEMESVPISDSEREEDLHTQNMGLSLVPTRLTLSKEDAECLKIADNNKTPMAECQSNSEVTKDEEFNLKIMEKEGEMDLDVSSLGNVDVHDSNISTIDTVASTVLTRNQDGCSVSVNSGLHFLNTGSSIVVLAQDLNNVGLSNIVVSMTVSSSIWDQTAQYGKGAPRIVYDGHLRCTWVRVEQRKYMRSTFSILFPLRKHSRHENCSLLQ